MPSVLVYSMAGSEAARLSSHRALGAAARKVKNAVEAEARSSIVTGSFINSIELMQGPLVKTKAGPMRDMWVVATDPAAYNIEYGRLYQDHDGMWRRKGGHLHFTKAYLRL